MEAIQKMEASLTTELIMQESKDRSKARRSAGSSPITIRSRSQIVDSIRIDTTMVTELEYLNMLPNDMSRVNEASFLQGIQSNTTMFNMKNSQADGGVSAQVTSDQNERIELLEEQLIEHKKQIEELEEEKRSQSDNASVTERSERSGTEIIATAAAKDEVLVK